MDYDFTNDVIVFANDLSEMSNEEIGKNVHALIDDLEFVELAKRTPLHLINADENKTVFEAVNEFWKDKKTIEEFKKWCKENNYKMSDFLK